MATEAEILDGCIRQDRAAQEALFRLYADKMLGVCLRYCRQEEDAHDLLHDGFIKVFQNIHTFRGASALKSWMTRIFVNAALNLYRKNRHRQNYLLLDNMSDEDGLAADALAIEDTEEPGFPDQVSPEEVLGWIQQLPDKYRLLINLYYVDNFSHKDIANQLNITESASKTQLHRARKMLQTISSAAKLSYEKAR